MAIFLSLTEIRAASADEVGSKARSLAELDANGFRVPPAIAIPASTYEAYLDATGLRDRIGFELGRKAFEEMRWEEIWDAALRIRNLFLVTPMPATMFGRLHSAVEQTFGNESVVVRSSAPGEDSGEASFAGLHESFVNVRGAEEVLKYIGLVWASLWSDAALLYRRELGLDVHHSRMAVVVQAMVVGECSGVAFSRNPNRYEEAVVEAVHGLNAGLVDGVVEPDRWTIERSSGAVTSHTAPAHRSMMVPGDTGIEARELDAGPARAAPLTNEGVERVYGLAVKAEERFGSAQDVEWTSINGDLAVLQSRPVTTLEPSPDGDSRAWYRSLTRSFDNLKVLWRRIEDELIPGMKRDAAKLANVNVSTMPDEELELEVARRKGIYQQWRDAYWADCIPFAHGVRLFGQYYNDTIRPTNPYAFMDLLVGTEMLSLKRNRQLQSLASMVRSDPSVRQSLERGLLSDCSAPLQDALNAFAGAYGGVFTTPGETVSPAFAAFLFELANATYEISRGPDPESRRREFLAELPEAARDRASDLLDLARASHRWRDDDNVYLDAVESQWLLAQEELRRRGGAVDARTPARDTTGENTFEEKVAVVVDASAGGHGPFQPRQLVGQPAGPGLASGVARVAESRDELLLFKQGEVLVCDALTPTMTFVIPLAAAVVERRGGMLIHGAIIAREYGVPCVTGVPDASVLIKTGMRLTVDGYLGIVRVDSIPPEKVSTGLHNGVTP